jgi:myosin-crossreactive antigen
MFPLKLKYEVFAAFIKFKSFAENQFSSKIKTLQSDSGGEFLSTPMTSCINSHVHRLLNKME